MEPDTKFKLVQFLVVLSINERTRIFLVHNYREDFVGVLAKSRLLHLKGKRRDNVTKKLPWTMYTYTIRLERSIRIFRGTKQAHKLYRLQWTWSG